MKYKLLIVDDEPANLRALERLFREQYDVLTAVSGAVALELLDHHNVALLITDQRMPEMTGIELLKKTVTLRPRMVRIILTGYTDVDALVEAINCGEVYRYVTKPWTNEELLLTVKRALEHYETIKKRCELESANKRLIDRMRDIQELTVLEVDGERLPVLRDLAPAIARQEIRTGDQLSS
jgi:two-component system, sensor histidine kinase and response regulator